MCFVFCLPRLPCLPKEHQTSQDASMCSDKFKLRSAFLLPCLRCQHQSHQTTIRMNPQEKQPDNRRLKPGLPSPDTARSAVSRAKRGLMREAHPAEGRNAAQAAQTIAGMRPHKKRHCTRLINARRAKWISDDGPGVSNNATAEKLGNKRAKLFVTNGVFTCHVLRLHKFKRDRILREPYSGIKSICPTSS